MWWITWKKQLQLQIDPRISITLGLEVIWSKCYHLILSWRRSIQPRLNKSSFVFLRYCTNWSQNDTTAFVLHFYSMTLLFAMQSAVIAMAIPSVRPSVCHTLVLYPDEWRVFWYQQWLGGDVPFHLKCALKVTHPLWKAPTSTNICL